MACSPKSWPQERSGAERYGIAGQSRMEGVLAEISLVHSLFMKSAKSEQFVH